MYLTLYRPLSLPNARCVAYVTGSIKGRSSRIQYDSQRIGPVEGLCNKVWGHVKNCALACVDLKAIDCVVVGLS
ncbi:hypothetical protein J6590_049884 [Homalodisca vitripennis]|nr:hypothetical protein J6590_049884 [Homalodisca vitripennis]